MSASLIGRLGSSTFRLSAAAVSMSLAGKADIPVASANVRFWVKSGHLQALIITLIGSYRCPFRAKSSTQCRVVQGLRIKTSRRDLIE